MKKEPILMIDDAIEDALRPLYGRPCWNAKGGHGSFMTTEFGRPHLEIKEPRPSNASASPAMQRHHARRHVYVHGQWHLWVYCCKWQVLTGKKRIGHSNLRGSSKAPIDRAARELDGQKLVHVSINPRDSSSVFEFDLGSRLETQPYDATSEQWHLFLPSKDVLSLRAHSHFSLNPSSTPPSEEKWRPLVPTDV